MELMEAMKSRRSVRAYEPRPVEWAKLERILQAAVEAPSGMNAQPWGFGVIEGVETLRSWSARAKEAMFKTLGDHPAFAAVRQRIAAPEFNLFYDAPTLILIFARPGVGITQQTDACLAAQNLMLAACELGLGTCWIGFAEPLFKLPEIQAELGLAPGHMFFAPIIVGYPKAWPERVERKAPEVLFRK
jgi:nitroreductase